MADRLQARQNLICLTQPIRLCRGKAGSRKDITNMKNKYAKRVVAFALAIAVACGSIAGCGQKKTEQKPQKPSSSTTQQEKPSKKPIQVKPDQDQQSDKDKKPDQDKQSDKDKKPDQNKKPTQSKPDQGKKPMQSKPGTTKPAKKPNSAAGA